MSWRAIIIILGLTIITGRAYAWDSMCYVHPPGIGFPDADFAGTPCTPGPGTMRSADPDRPRSRWVGSLDEHRQIWEKARAMGGLPNDLSEVIRYRVYTSKNTITVDGDSVYSLVPVDFKTTRRVQTREITIGELAQIPDFAYGLWDWAVGAESCPLPGVSVNHEDCHDFTKYMGWLNSNHFNGQTGLFYIRAHGLAMARAAECLAMKTALAGQELRFGAYLRDCELEAQVIESMGQHHLHETLSAGHMWYRWGSPDFDDFPTKERIGRAGIVALTSGVMHGARGVLESKLPGWVDIPDAMCFPTEGVEIGWPGSPDRFPVVGDEFLQEVTSGSAYDVQYKRLYSCAVNSMREVYEASGQIHGALGPPDPDIEVRDPTAEECLGGLATNKAIKLGMSINAKIAGVPVSIPLNGLTAPGIVFAVEKTSGATVSKSLSNAYRHDLAGIAALAGLSAKIWPDDLDLAGGGLGPLVGVDPGDAYATKAPMAPYVDPELPWPATTDVVTPDAAARATSLARVFHRAHATDWCQQIDATYLGEVRDNVTDAGMDTEGQAAACEACAELAIRHLRVGTGPDEYDTSLEPLCHYLHPSPPPEMYIYQPNLSGASSASLARVWCGCAEDALVLTYAGIARVRFGPESAEHLPIAGVDEGFLALGSRPRDIATSAYRGALGVVTNFMDGTVSIVSLERGLEHEIDIDGDPSTTTEGAPAGITRISFGSSSGPRGVAVTPDGRYALVAVSGSETVAVIDLEDYDLCSLFPVGSDPDRDEVPDDVAITRDGTKAYVSLVGTSRQPGDSVAVLDMAGVLDCTTLGDEVTGYVTGLGGRPRPGALELHGASAYLAIAGRGNDHVIIVDTTTDTIVDLMPDDPTHHFFAAASIPSALVWDSAGTRVFYGHEGGVSDTRLDGYGTVRIGQIWDGWDTYDVGVRDSVRALLLSDDENWVYVGDAAGNLTVLSLDLWDGEPDHIRPPYEHTGGCLERESYAVPCSPTLELGSPIRAITRF